MNQSLKKRISPVSNRESNIFVMKLMHQDQVIINDSEQQKLKRSKIKNICTNFSSELKARAK